MKKIIISPELKSRLTNASFNGSLIATDILIQLKGKPEDVLKGKINYFSTKRIKRQDGSQTSMRVIFTACNKDIKHPNFPDRNNPQAPWFKENRTDLEPSTFLDSFKHLPEYAEEQLNYFTNSICVDSKVEVKMYDKMTDMEEAYNESNYYPYDQIGSSSLHNSCMRHEDTARNSADFYYNFAGTKIIVARDSNNNILGRAIVWEKVEYKDGENTYMVSTIDRIYFTHDFIIKLILDCAQKNGIHLRKK